MVNCTSLAAALSASYYSTDAYNGTRHGSVPSYLESHGVLLTICFPSQACAIDDPTHISASWINADLGPRTIEGLSNLGMILDPSVVDIRCIFPTDAGTAVRDDSGCGPFLPYAFGDEAMGFWERLQFRRKIDRYKNMNFGAQTHWTDIPCWEFLVPLRRDGNTFWKDEEGSIQYQSNTMRAKEQLEAIMGRPVCSLGDDAAPRFESTFMMLYSGSSSWPLDQWQSVMDRQDYFTKEFPEIRLWNEIVINLPLQLSDIVSAVFYMDPPAMYCNEPLERYRHRARQQAALLGKDIPVLKMDATATGTDRPLFVCDDQDVTSDLESTTK